MQAQAKSKKRPASPLAEPSAVLPPVMKNIEYLNWTLFLSAILATKERRDLFFTEAMSFQHFVKTIHCFVLPCRYWTEMLRLAANIRTEPKLAAFSEAMLERIYDNYYVPLTSNGPFMLVDDPTDGWIKLAWRTSRDRFDVTLMQDYLTPTFVEVDVETYEKMMLCTRYEICRLGTRLGILTGIGSLMIKLPRAEIAIAGIAEERYMDLAGGLYSRPRLVLTNNPRSKQLNKDPLHHAYIVAIDCYSNMNFDFYWHRGSVWTPSPQFDITDDFNGFVMESKQPEAPPAPKRRKVAEIDPDLPVLLKECPRKRKSCQLCQKAIFFQQCVLKIQEEQPELVQRTTNNSARVRALKYGSLTARFVNLLAHRVRLSELDSVIDLGSGQGLAVMQLIFQTGCRGTAIEIQSALVEQSIEIADILLESNPLLAGRLTIVEGDLAAQDFSRYSIIIANNICYDRDTEIHRRGGSQHRILNQEIMEKAFAEARHGALVVTTSPFVSERRIGRSNSSNRRLQEPELSFSQWQVSVRGIQNMFSWTSTRSDWFVYRISRPLSSTEPVATQAPSAPSSQLLSQQRRPETLDVMEIEIFD